MADLPPYPDTGGNAGVEPDRGSPTSTPRWVKVFGIIAFIMVLLFIILHFTFGGLRSHTRPSSVPERGVQRP